MVANRVGPAGGGVASWDMDATTSSVAVVFSETGAGVGVSKTIGDCWQANVNMV